MLPLARFFSRRTSAKTVPGHVVLDEEYEWVFGLKHDDVQDDPDDQKVAEDHPAESLGERGTNGAYRNLGFSRSR